MFLSDEQNELRGEIDWLAFLYVAGELDADAAAAFERRLADEQPVREAVARAVEWTQLVSAAESQFADDRGSDASTVEIAPAEKRAAAWGTRLSWMAIGGLLSLLIAAFVSSSRFGALPSDSNGASGELATAWYETRQELTTTDEVGPLHPISANLLDDDEAAASATGDESWLEINTPTWMTAAVAGVAATSRTGQGSGGAASQNDADDEDSGVN